MDPEPQLWVYSRSGKSSRFRGRTSSSSNINNNPLRAIDMPYASLLVFSVATTGLTREAFSLRAPPKALPAGWVVRSFFASYDTKVIGFRRERGGGRSLTMRPPPTKLTLNVMLQQSSTAMKSLLPRTTWYVKYKYNSFFSGENQTGSSGAQAMVWTACMQHMVVAASCCAPLRVEMKKNNASVVLLAWSLINFME